jgi:DUF917 family protein
MSIEFTRDSIDDLARGAAFLGTGGGGDPYIGSLLLHEAMRTVPSIRILDVEEVPDDSLVVPSAMMGAPTVLIEKLPNGREAEIALRRLEAELGRRAFATMPAEIGGLNALLPLVLAARLGLPVVDADGMGRAFPELQMTTFHVHGRWISPLAICDEHGSSVVIHACDDFAAERLARATVVAMGATCQICGFSLTGADLRASAVPGTITAAIGIGRAIRLAREANSDPFEALLGFLRTSRHYTSSAILFDGKIVDLDRQTTGGFARGRVRIEALAPWTGTMEVQFQNEHLVAHHDGRLRAIVPDLICMVDRETAEPITTEAMRYGQRVKVLGVSAAPVMRSPAALAVFGPQAFGLAEPFTPIEELNPP